MIEGNAGHGRFQMIRYAATFALGMTLSGLSGSIGAHAQDVTIQPQVGPRPFYLVEKMKDGPLKATLKQCTGPFRKTDFSIGHRGAAPMRAAAI